MQNGNWRVDSKENEEDVRRAPVLTIYFRTHLDYIGAFQMPWKGVFNAVVSIIFKNMYHQMWSMAQSYCLINNVYDWRHNHAAYLNIICFTRASYSWFFHNFHFCYCTHDVMDITTRASHSWSYSLHSLVAGYHHTTTRAFSIAHSPAPQQWDITKSKNKSLLHRINPLWLLISTSFHSFRTSIWFKLLK